MSLTDSTYFVLEINIPQGTYNTIAEHIARYERDILIQLLGYDLAKLVLAYDSSTSPQRIKDIVEGKEYAVGDYMVKWNGLLNTEKVSILSYYVYMKYLENYIVTFQNIGLVSSNAEGGTMVSPGVKYQQIGYALRELAGYSGQDQYVPSLYNFLSVYESTYTEWLFNEFRAPNVFGI